MAILIGEKTVPSFDPNFVLLIIKTFLSVSHKSLEINLMEYNDLLTLKETFNLVSFGLHYLVIPGASAATSVASNCSSSSKISQRMVTGIQDQML